MVGASTYISPSSAPEIARTGVSISILTSIKLSASFPALSEAIILSSYVPPGLFRILPDKRAPNLPSDKSFLSKATSDTLPPLTNILISLKPLNVSLAIPVTSISVLYQPFSFKSPFVTSRDMISGASLSRVIVLGSASSLINFFSDLLPTLSSRVTLNVSVKPDSPSIS